MTDLQHRHTERLADVGLAPMLAALAAVHVVVGAAAAAVLDHPAAVLVAAADGAAAVALVGAAALGLRLGPHARAAIPAAASSRRFDLGVAVTALGLAAVATALRMIATGASWTGLELPLAVVVCAALPGRLAPLAAVAVTVPACGAVAGVVVRGPGTAGEVLGSLLPLVAIAAAGAVGFAWRRRTGLLEDRLRASHRTAHEGGVRDAVTGAVNRRGLEMVAGPMLQNARRQGEAVHCLLVDVDDFRRLNEVAGADAGDEVLRAVTAALQAAVRGTDVVGRWSGDEFVVVGPGTGTSPLELERRVHAHLTTSPPLPAELAAPRVSIGSATLVPWDEGDLSALLRRADRDMRLRRSLRRQRADRDSGSIAPPPGRITQDVEGGAEH